MITKITPCLWFDDQAEEAVKFYTSVFPSSRIVSVTRYGPGARRPEGSVMIVVFELDGQELSALNGGPEFRHSPAVSFVVHCRDQGEVDRYWNALVDGGTPVQCGWLTDRFGISWQVVPVELFEMVRDGDPGRVQRVTDAMLRMVKLDLPALAAARDAA